VKYISPDFNNRKTNLIKQMTIKEKTSNQLLFT